MFHQQHPFRGYRPEPNRREQRDILRHRLEPGDGQAGTRQVSQDRADAECDHLQVDYRTQYRREYIDKVDSEEKIGVVGDRRGGLWYVIFLKSFIKRFVEWGHWLSRGSRSQPGISLRQIGPINAANSLALERVKQTGKIGLTIITLSGYAAQIVQVWAENVGE